MRIAIFSIILFSFPILTGCRNRYDYAITSPIGSEEIARAPRRMGYAIGLTSKGEGVNELLVGLKKSNLFDSIFYPIQPGNSVDGIMEVNLNYDTHVNNTPWAACKVLLVISSLCILDGVFDYERVYICNCTVELLKDGKKLKTYTASGTSTYRGGLSNESHHEDEVKNSAMRALQANLVQQLIEDFAFIERSLNPNFSANSHE